MIASISLVAVLMVGLGVFVIGCKQEPTPAPAGKAAESGGAPKVEIAQKLCPVTGEKIDPTVFIDYNGRRIYFCCDSCPPTFKKDPEKYLKKLDEQMKSGAAEEKPAAPTEKAAVWTCPMHPEVRADKPGKCPKCGMALVPAAK
jgi:YHS domain-containing protein